MRCILLGSALAAIASCASFHISNPVFKHAQFTKTTLGYIEVSVGPERNDLGRCYGSARGNSDTKLADIIGVCEDNAGSFSLKRQPNGNFKFSFNYYDSGGDRIIPASDLSTYEAFAFGTPRQFEQLTPGNFNVCYSNC